MAATQVRQWKHTTLTRAGHERNASLLQTTPECVHVEVFRWLELPAVPVAALRSIHLEEQLRLVCTVEATRVDVRQHRQSIHRQKEIGRASCRERVCQYV